MATVVANDSAQNSAQNPINLLLPVKNFGKAKRKKSIEEDPDGKIELSFFARLHNFFDIIE